MTFRIIFEVEDKRSILAEGTAVAIDYINKVNPKTEVYTNNHVYHLPKDSFVLIDIEFKRKEILALSRSSDVKYAKIGQIDGSSIRYEEGDKSFKIVKVYNETEKQWEEVKEIGDFDKIKEIRVEEVILEQQQRKNNSSNARTTAATQEQQQQRKNNSSNARTTAATQEQQQQRKNNSSNARTTAATQEQQQQRKNNSSNARTTAAIATIDRTNY